MLGQASVLNDACDCLPLEQALVMREISSDFPALRTQWQHETLFAATSVFLSEQDMDLMTGLISSVEQLVQTPVYHQAIANRDPLSPPIQDPFTPGVMMGYDFHLTPSGPALIEINTNAGGAFLADSLYGTHSVSASACPTIPSRLMSASAEVFAEAFRAEWHAAGRTGNPAQIAIVDSNPEAEFLLVDMQLAQIALQALGAMVHIVPADQLRFVSGELVYQDHVIDFVYNRLTDFPLKAPEHEAIRQAWRSGAAVVSPSPDHHRLYADKRNLSLFRDIALHQHAGLVSPVSEQLLASIPNTVTLTQENADELWATRKQWYFKPATAFGSRAVYSGRKITRKKWAEILANPPYVAQALVPPATRLVSTGARPLKYDLRLYCYAGEVQLAVARLYDGQTTNFRTAGGGFAAILLCE